MKYFLFSFMILLFAAKANAQDVNALTRSADKMKEAVMSGDLNTLAFYTHPAVVSGMGGKEQMVAAVKKGNDEMKKSGASFRGVRMGTPGKFFRTPKHIFSLLPQTLLINIKDGYLETQTSMLGVSDDQGKMWKFVSAGNLSRAQLKSLFPDLPDDLKIPQQTEPLFYKN